MSARKLLALLLLAGAAVLGFAVGGNRNDQLPANDPPHTRSDPPPNFGWVDDPDAVRETLTVLRCGRFQDTAAFLAPQEQPDDVFLWEACTAATGEVPPARDQKAVGACVAFATASAVEYLLCVQIANGSCEAYRDISPEVIYGGSRVEIGGGRVRGDGTVGAWAARFVSEYGVVPRGLHGTHDLRTYSEALCREFGRFGVRDLAASAKEHPVRGVANVKTWEECRAAVRNGYPVVVCSSQGFGMQRDADGFCPPRGTWYHAMTVVGVRGGKRPGGFLLNSWGPDAHTGPRWPEDAPACGFWVDAAALGRMLRQGDSWAFSLAVGFPRVVLEDRGWGGAGIGNPKQSIGDRVSGVGNRRSESADRG